MKRWLTTVATVTGFIAQAIWRFYGTFFLALAMLLFYWSGRALLAYRAGIRAAWSDPGAGIAGLIAALLSVYAGLRMVRGRIPRERAAGISPELDALIEEAMRLEKTDPAAAQQLMDNYFTREAAVTESRRAELRTRAPYDLGAALQLRRELEKEVANNTLLRKEMLANVPVDKRATMLNDIEASDQQLKSELQQLSDTIARLQPR